MAESTRWRLNITSNVAGNNIVGVVELEFFDTIGSPISLATGGTASSSTDNSSYVSSRAFDGVKNTHGWYTQNNTPTGWLQYTFQTAVDIKEIELTVPSNEFGSGVQPRDFQIQYYDGTEWIIAAEYLDVTDWTGYESRRYQVGESIIYQVAGKCVRGTANLPANRDIYAYDMVDGSYVGFSQTDSFGNFSITVGEIPPVFIRIVDPEGIYSTEIRENITPTIVTIE